MKKAIAIGAAVVLTLGGCGVVAASTVTMSVVSIFASNGGSCGGGSTVSAVASSTGGLTVTAAAGSKVTLGSKQLDTASKMIAVAHQLNIPQTGIEAMVMATLQESKFWIYANTTAYPESASIPHDKDGSDHDSLGPLQQRPQAGWGAVAQLMDPTYAAQAFFGGPTGPNHGSPRGLLDVPGWQSMTPGEAAQSVQVSAYPAAYDNWLPAADAIIQQIGGGSAGSASCGSASGGIAMPLDQGFNMTDKFGPRTAPIEGASSWHPADDLQNWPNPCGRPVYAILPGRVIASDRLTLSVKSPDGFVVSYLHSHKTDRLVNIGDPVTMGEKITLVGDEAPATGCHLDLRINVTGSTNAAVNGLPKAQDLGGPSSAKGFVDPEAFFKLYGGELCAAGKCKREY